jgi:Fe2+ transport system protein B
MMDEAARKRIMIEQQKLSHILGTSIVTTIATQGYGIELLF